jgi:HEPN domain-containing protein
MSRASIQKTNDTNPKALLNYARQYFKAAEVVFNNEPGLTRPLNYLYFHTLELLLKSFLRAKGRRPERNHEIYELYKDATGLGLKISDDPFELQNIVCLLETGNLDHAFRYGTPRGTTEPRLDWTREVVGRLLTTVGGLVDLIPPTGPGVGIRSTLLLGKPVPKI